MQRVCKINNSLRFIVVNMLTLIHEPIDFGETRSQVFKKKKKKESLLEIKHRDGSKYYISYNQVF